MLELILLFVFCALLGLSCLGMIGWVLLSPEEIGVERIFLLVVCFVLGALFLGLSAWMARRSPLRELWKAEVPEPTSKQAGASAQKQETAVEEAEKSAS